MTDINNILKNLQEQGDILVKESSDIEKKLKIVGDEIMKKVEKINKLISTSKKSGSVKNISKIVDEIIIVRTMMEKVDDIKI